MTPHEELFENELALTQIETPFSEDVEAELEDNDFYGDVDELTEMQDFAHDDDFSNMYPTEDGFISNGYDYD